MTCQDHGIERQVLVQRCFLNHLSPSSHPFTLGGRDGGPKGSGQGLGVEVMGGLADPHSSHSRLGLHSGTERAGHQHHGQQPNHPAAGPILSASAPFLPAATYVPHAEPRGPEPLHGYHGPAAKPAWWVPLAPHWGVGEAGCETPERAA